MVILILKRHLELCLRGQLWLQCLGVEAWRVHKQFRSTTPWSYPPPPPHRGRARPQPESAPNAHLLQFGGLTDCMCCQVYRRWVPERHGWLLKLFSVNVTSLFVILTSSRRSPHKHQSSSSATHFAQLAGPLPPILYTAAHPSFDALHRQGCGHLRVHHRITRRKLERVLHLRVKSVKLSPKQDQIQSKTTQKS